MRPRSIHDDVGNEPSLEHRTREDGLAFTDGDTDHVGHERAIEPHGECRREISGLVGMREDDRIRRQAPDCLGRRLDVRVSRVAFQQRMLGHVHGGHAPPARILGRCIKGAPQQQQRHWRTSRDVMRRGNRLPRGSGDNAVALFTDDENHRDRQPTNRTGLMPDDCPLECTSLLAEPAHEFLSRSLGRAVNPLRPFASHGLA
jgi:hypothetical protein